MASAPRAYLRILYGPGYTAIEKLRRLRARTLHEAVASSARIALGIEALERFVRKEPLRRVHEAVLECWR